MPTPIICTAEHNSWYDISDIYGGVVVSHKLVNPIIPGFYPDPSIIRVGDDFYMACSSFELCPGIPIFHSRDLANWEQICYAVTKEQGFHVEKNGMTGGVMAPTLRYSNGTYYIINANFSDRGNYIITAKDPAGPWSELHYLEGVPGIDASLFFDHDGSCYIMGTGEYTSEYGEKKHGIWLASYDIENYQLTSEAKYIFDSALRVGASPEAPHIYHVGEYYYLIIAEGGTEHYHSVMAARSREIMGFYEGCPANPVLTHRHLGFHAPITNIGHADLVELKDGSWYAVMLGSRLIDGAYKNLGRETFICPVIWERDWPVFAPETGKVEWEYPLPECLTWTPFEDQKNTYDDFNREDLDPSWVCAGTPYERFWRIEDSKLYIRCLKTRINEEIRKAGWLPEYRKDTFLPAILRRQTAINQSFSCRMSFLPDDTESAGLTVLMAMNHNYVVERAVMGGKQVVRVILATNDFTLPQYMPGFTCKTTETVLACAPWDQEEIVLKVVMEGEKFTILCGENETSLVELATVDGALINPEKVGCMVGTMVGMFASGNGIGSGKEAAFDWFRLE